jgi:hypothetical protein
MARIEWIEQRLLNWARWRVAERGGGALGYAAVRLGDADGGRSGYITASIPISDVEAAATDDAVQGLSPRRLGLTLVVVYCGSGGMAEHAAQLACSVVTVYARVDQAHQLLAQHFRAADAGRKAERVRVEALQRRGFTR